MNPACMLQVNDIEGHNASLAILGVFILWFGWYAFIPSLLQSRRNVLSDTQKIALTNLEYFYLRALASTRHYYKSIANCAGKD